jgi:hypothetical protein
MQRGVAPRSRKLCSIVCIYSNMGDWLAAVAEALEDAHTAKEEAARRRTTAAAEDPDVLQSRCFETCTAKVLSGSVRAGHRVLRSSGMHPAPPDTCAHMATKCIVGAEAMASKPGLKRRARMAKAPKISPRHVSDAVEDMPGSRAPGCAGWQNSRLKSVIAEEPGLTGECQSTWRCYGGVSSAYR